MDVNKIKEFVEDGIDQIFVDVHMEANTKSGDITPDQAYRLDGIKRKLTRLMYDQVKQNLS